MSEYHPSHLTDRELRLECLKLAVATAQRADTEYILMRAQHFYRAITEDTGWSAQPFSRVPAVGRDSRTPQDAVMPPPRSDNPVTG